MKSSLLSPTDYESLRPKNPNSTSPSPILTSFTPSLLPSNPRIPPYPSTDTIFIFSHEYIIFNSRSMLPTLRTLARYHAVKNMDEYKTLVSSLNTPYLVDFTASWCGPCKMLWPVLEKREKEAAGKWTIIKVDVDLEELSQVVNEHSVSGVPTLAFYKGSQKLFQRSGYVDDAGFKKLEEKYLA